MTDHELDRRLRRAHPLPQTPPGDDPWAQHLLAAITATDPNEPDTPTARTRRARRPLALVAGVVALAVAGGAVAAVVADRGDRPREPFGPNPAVALLDRLAAPNPNPVALRPEGVMGRSLDLSRTRLLADRAGFRFYIGPARAGGILPAEAINSARPAVCLMLTPNSRRAQDKTAPDRFGSFLCGPAHAGGRLSITTPTIIDGRRMPRVMFGIVPDNVVSVTAEGGQTVPVRNNVYVLPLGKASRILLTRRNGTSVPLAVGKG